MAVDCVPRRFVCVLRGLDRSRRDGGGRFLSCNPSRMCGDPAGAGVVLLVMVGLDYLYRRRPRIWVAIAPSPITVMLVAGGFGYLAAAPLGGGVAFGYLLGAALSTQWVSSVFEREHEQELRHLLGEPDERD